MSKFGRTFEYNDPDVSSVVNTLKSDISGICEYRRRTFEWVIVVLITKI